MLKSMQFFYTKARSRLNEVWLHKYELKLIFAFFAVKTRMNRIAEKVNHFFSDTLWSILRKSTVNMLFISVRIVILHKIAFFCAYFCIHTFFGLNLSYGVNAKYKKYISNLLLFLLV